MSTSVRARDQGPTGVSRRRQRISDTETEERMLRAAIALVGEQGLTVALSHEDGRATELAAMSDEAVAWLLRGAMLCAVSPAPLLVLDAAEEGIPQGLIAPLAAMLRSASERVQVVLTGASEALDAALTEAFAGAPEGPRLVRLEV